MTTYHLNSLAGSNLYADLSAVPDDPEKRAVAQVCRTFGPNNSRHTDLCVISGRLVNGQIVFEQGQEKNNFWAGWALAQRTALERWLKNHAEVVEPFAAMDGYYRTRTIVKREQRERK